MRRALGPTLVLAAAVVLAGVELGLGCSHDPKPAVVEPAGPPSTAAASAISSSSVHGAAMALS